ncbi:MAG: Ig-like domain-containing protein [Kofleriaceae bacterium]
MLNTIVRARCAWIVFATIVLAGCFSPSFDDAKILCGPNEMCPPGLECFEQICRTKGSVPTDAAIDADMTAPGTPSLSSVTPSSPANENTPRVIGNAEADTTVTIFSDASCTVQLASGTAAELADPGIAVSVADDTTSGFYATARDTVGNSSPCSAPVMYIEDSLAPATPEITGTLPASPSRSTNPAVRGTGEPAAEILLFATADCSDTPIATGTADLDGSFSIPISVGVGSSTELAVIARDAADNASPCSGSVMAYQQDSSAVASPTFTGTTPGSPSNSSLTPTITGVTEAGAMVRLYTDATCSSAVAGTGTADGTGAFSIMVTVGSNTSTTFYGLAEDTAVSTTSQCSQVGINYIHDSVAPTSPAILGANPTSPANTTTPNIVGTAEANASVSLYTTSDCSGSAVGTASASGAAAFSVPVTVTGTTTFYARATDLATNASACSTAFTFVYDATAPDAPVLSATIPASPSTSNNTPIVVGTSEPNALIKIYRTSDCTGAEAATSAASAGGTFGIGITVPSNSVSPLAATATDSAGNVSACSTAVTYMHDSLAPPVPMIMVSTPTSPANVNTPTVSGSTEAGSDVRLYSASNCTAQIGAPLTADVNGDFSTSISVGDNTSTTLYTRAIDVAGNTSPCSPGFVYIEDSTAPAAPTLTPIAPSATVTNPSIAGIAEAASSVALFDNASCSGAPIASDQADAAGAFTMDITVGLNTTTNLSARATDAAGNLSPCSGSISYVHDNMAPSAPTSLGTTPISPAGSTTPSVTGNAEAGSTVRIFTNPTCSTGVAGLATATGGGAFSVALSVAGGSTTTFYATSTDAAGNSSSCSVSFVTYISDGLAPEEPTGLATTPGSPSSSNTPNVTGTAEPNATIRLYTTGDCSGAPAFTGTAIGTGSFTIATSVAANSTNTWRATATDSAGNASACSTSSVTYVEDSTAPAVPTFATSTPTSPANANGPAISGGAEEGATVRLWTSATCASGLAGTGTATAGNTFSIAVTVNDDTNTSFYANATDAAGNASSCTSMPLIYVEDSQAPNTPNGLGTNPASPVNNPNPSIIGNAEPGSTVSVYTSVTCTGLAGTGVATAGAFSIPVTVGSNTTTLFYTRATDAAGNQSSCSSSVTYIEDSTSPALPVVSGTTPASPASNMMPVVTGTAEPGTTVRIYSGSCATLLATGTATGAGTFAIAASVTANTTTTLRATATDSANNTSGCSTTSVAYSHDSSGPSAPTALGVSPASPKNENNPVITGLAEPGSTVRVYRNSATCSSGLAGSSVADGGGAFSIGVSVVDNTTGTYYATATDSANNTSPCSTSNVTYVEDSAAPSAPTNLDTTPSSPSNSASPTVTGDAETGATVQLFTNSACSGSPTATGTATSGSFSIAATVAANSTTTFYARALDVAGNTSGCSASFATFVQDSTPPADPSGLATTPASPSNNNMPAVTGTTEANATVRIYSDATCTALLATGTANGSGAFSVATAVTLNATTTVRARATDLAGNVSGCSSSTGVYVHDSVAPSAPTSLGVAPSSPNSSLAPTVTGSAEAGSTVRIYSDAGCSALKGTGTATGGGTFSIATTVTSGSSTTFRATTTDTAGNVSSCSASTVTYVHDATAPAVPTGLATTPTSPSSSNAPSVTGLTEGNATVTIYTDAGCTAVAATGTAAGDGTFSIAVSVGTNSTTTFRAKASDGAGNTSACSTSNVTYVEDSAAPSAPVLTGTTPASPANDNTPIVNGTAESGSTVRIYTNAACTTQVGTATASGGTFAIDVTAVTDNTTTSYYGTATDAAGNASACTIAPISYIEDSAAPAPPSSLTTTPTSPANNNNPSINGSTEANATVTAYTDAGCSTSAGTDTADASGNFSIPVTVSNNSTTTFRLRSTDVAGNTSACGAANITYVEDSTAVAPPILTGSTPTSPSNTSTTPSITGTTTAGLNIRLYTNASCSGADVGELLGAGAAFSIPVAVTANTSTTFYATANNGVNTSACSAGVTYVHDSIAPALPTALGVTPSSPSNQNNPTITGMAETGSTVRIYTNATCSSAIAGTGTASAGTFSIAVTVAADTTTTFYARSTDAASNVSGCSTSNVTYVEDSTAPALPLVSSTTPSSPSSTTTTPMINGTAEASSTVRVYPTSDCSGPPSGTGTAAGGTFSISVSVSANTSTTFKATATDAAGNASACSTTSVSYVHDNQAPATPSGLATIPVSPSNNNSPAVTGNADPNTSVTIYTTPTCTPASAVGTGAATIGGTFSITVTPALGSNTTTTFYARSVDAANNQSACSTSNVTYVEDSNAPSAPVFTGTTPTSPSKASTTPTINGTAEPNATVTLWTNPTCSSSSVGSGTATGGTFAISVTVTANSSTTFYSRATDAAGNPSACSAGITYVHDSSAPTTPSSLVMVPASPANMNTPSLTGNAETGATVGVYTDATCTTLSASGTAAAGAFSIQLSVADNTTTTFHTKATDAAGNASGCSSGVPYIEDSTAPAVATFTGTTPASPSNASTTPTINGTAETGASVSLFTNAACSGGAAGTATAAAGAFALGVSVTANTTTTFWAKVTDAANNASACSPTSQSYTHDNVAPATPGALATNPISPSNTTSLALSGTGEIGTTIRIYSQAGCAGAITTTTTVGGGGSWSVNLTAAANATTTFTARAIDAASNLSSCSASVAYVHDSIAPAAPTITGSNPTSPGNANSPLILGTAEASSIVTLYSDAGCTVVAGSGPATSGSFSITVNVGDNSSTTYRAKATDAANNTSTCSSAFTFIEDSAPPVAPSGLATTPVSPSNSNNPNLTGSAEAGATVRVYLAAACAGATHTTATANGSGAFTAPLTVPSNATSTISAQAVDAAGNMSACSSAISYVEDSVAPTQPTVVTSPVSPSNVNNFDVIGTTDPSVTLQLFLNGACSGSPFSQTTTNAVGQGSIGIGVADGAVLTMTMRAVDTAGNQSSCSASITYTEDSTPPAVPVFTTSAPVSPSNVNNPTISGTSDANVTIRLFTTASCSTIAYTGTANGSGAWSIPVTVADNTTTAFYARAVDAAGNVSSCTTTPLTYAEDSAAPGTPTITSSTPPSPATTTSPNINGQTTESGVLIKLFSNAACTGSSIGSGNSTTFGTFTIGVTVAANSSTSIYATAQDSAGNVSGCGGPLIYVHDTIAPAAPTALGVNPASPANNNNPSVTGTAQAGSSIKLYTNSACSGGALTSGSSATSSFSVPVTVANDTTTTFWATATDAAGNASACSTSSVQYREDSTANPPVLSSTTPTSPSSTSTSPTINGTAEASTTIFLYSDASCSTQVASGSVTAGGSFALSVTVSPNTSTTFRGRIRDAANNLSSCSSTSVTYIHDNVGPTFAGPTSATSTAEDGIFLQWSAASDTFTSSANMRYDICYSTAPSGCNTFVALETTSAGATSWTVGGLEMGTRYWFKMRAVDQAGNVSAVPSAQVTDRTWGPQGTVAVAAGYRFSCAQMSDGTVRCWGNNTKGECGDGTTASPRTTPRQVVGLTDVISLAAGGSDLDENAHACAVKSNGTVWCWGAGNYGQLGNGASPAFVSSPVQVSGITTAISVTAGWGHSCAALSNGQVRCWGANGFGQLGNSTFTTTNTPVTVSSVTGALNVSAGNVHTCALISDGTVRCWGEGGNGRLGNGASSTSNVPVTVSLGASDRARQLDVGPAHACVTTQAGQARCWGANTTYQLGDSTMMDRSTPVAVYLSGSSNVSSVASVSAGGSGTTNGTTCIVRAMGVVRCFGHGALGAIGNGGTANEPYPDAVNIGSPKSVSVGSSHTCGLVADGRPECWGTNTTGQLGNASTTTSLVPVNVADLYTRESGVAIASGYMYSCARMSTGEAKCWGYGEYGQLGDENETTTPYPLGKVIDTASVMDYITDVSAGRYHACAVRADGNVWCWGQGTEGQLGNNLFNNSPNAVEVQGISTYAIQVASGSNHACALLVGGTVMCWGLNQYGQLGNNVSIPGTSLATAVAVSGLTGAVEISAGYGNTCARLGDGTVRCWGAGFNGALGNGGTTHSSIPVTVTGVATTRSIGTGVWSSCAVIANSNMMCWGHGAYGQMGNSTVTPNNATAVFASGSGYVKAGVGDYTVCAIKSNGVPSCWGYNGYGEVGDGTTTNPRTSPGAVVGLDTISDMGTGTYHTCGLHSDGTAECWGLNSFGALGDGSTTGDSIASPVPVIYFP